MKTNKITIFDLIFSTFPVAKITYLCSNMPTFIGTCEYTCPKTYPITHYKETKINTLLCTEPERHVTFKLPKKCKTKRSFESGVSCRSKIVIVKQILVSYNCY